MRHFRLYLILLCYFVCTGIAVHAQVVAGFTASPTSGCAPLVVNFTNTSTGATSYSWDLGNTNTSFLTNASASYLTPGTYTVKLTATAGSVSNTATMTITVNAPPVVSFSANNTTICKGTTVTFSNTTNLVSPGPGTYSWNFGDGTTSAAQSPSHPYLTPGFYSVTQSATNSSGCTTSTVINSYIDVLANPVAQFTASGNNFCTTPAQVTFTDQSTGNGALSYAWSFGDNSSSATASPVHSYAATGSFTVKEVVTDGHGCMDSSIVNNDITIQKVTASMNAPDTGCANTTVNFINTTSGPGLGSFWDFGDGFTDGNTNTSHVYSSGGSYTVKLVAYVNGCNDTATKQIYIRDVPIGSFTYTPAHPCPAPINVQFTSTGPAGATYTWIFGDGTTSPLANPLHTYNVDSFLPVSMIVNVKGCLFIASDTVKIYSLLDASFMTARAGCPPLTDTFHSGAVTSVPCASCVPLPPYPYALVSYFNDFGDGSPASTLPAPYHTYTAPGYYHTSYSYTTANGCVFSDTSSVAVGQKPVIDLFTANLHVCKDDTVFFHAHAHGQSPFVYFYQFGQKLAKGDGGSTDDTAQIFLYDNPGVYHTDVIVSNYACPDTSTGLTIVVDSPGAGFTFKQPCDTPSKVVFKSGSIGATSFVWLFGDGDTSTALNPVHFYNTPGTYTVMLAAYNSRSGCRDTSKQAINILDYRAKIIVPDTALCKYGYLHFSSSYNTPNQKPLAQQWFINGSPIDTSAQITYQFNVPGIYSVTLKETDANKCVDTTNQKILVAQPVVGLMASPRQICVPGGALFTDSSSYTPGTYPASHTWTFGDGTILTTGNNTINYTYSTGGLFNIKEVVTDNIGCTDSATRLNYIGTHKPVASFAAANTNKCAGDTVTFVNTGTPNLQTMYWNFGDGSTSTATQPVHSYSASGSYTVTLAVTDTAGCTDTIVRTNYVSITKPRAAFAESNGSGVCVPLIVQFNNTSTGGSTYAWNFGNSNTSVATNPTNSYTVPGNYTIGLTVTDSHGCKDSTSGHVTLYGFSGSFTYNPLAGCPPLAVNFTAATTGIPSITWDFSDGTVTTPSASLTATHIYRSPGKYVPKIILVDSAGCHLSSLGTDTIKVDKVHAGFTETKAICIYDTVHFTDTTSGLFFPASSWLWYLGDGTVSSLQNPVHNYHTSGSFTVTLIASDVSGCKDTAVNTVSVRPLPVITTTGDTTICPGDSARVGAQGGVSYAWTSTGVHCTTCNPTYIAATTPGYYLVTGTDANGCRNKDSVKISFTYKTVSYVGPGGQLCVGDSITLSDSGAQVYNWVPSTSLSDGHSAHPVATPTGSTTYMAIARTASCIPDTNYVAVTVNPQPHVTALGGATVVAGSKVNLQAYGPNIVSFLWNHAELLSCDNCTDPVATMQQTTQFTVTATNQYGCEDSAHVLVNVLCDKSQVFIPNTFTPNGDGQNDVFYPRGVGIRVVKSFRVYNRWGQLVFERDDIPLNDERSGWDGTFNGAKPIPDTYVYAMDAVCENGSAIDWKGDVTLVR